MHSLSSSSSCALCSLRVVRLRRTFVTHSKRNPSDPYPNKIGLWIERIHPRLITRKVQRKTLLNKMTLFQLSFVRYTQFLASFFTTWRQHSPSISCLHTFTKSMYGLATTAMRLKCTFHFPYFLAADPWPAVAFSKYDPGEADLVSISSHRSPHPWIVKGRQR